MYIVIEQFQTCKVPQSTESELKRDVYGVGLHFGLDKLQHFPHVPRLGSQWRRLISGYLPKIFKKNQS